MNYHDPVDPMLKQFLKSRAQDLVIPNTVENAVGNVLSSLSDQKVNKRFPLKRWRWAAAVVAFFFILSAFQSLPFRHLPKYSGLYLPRTTRISDLCEHRNWDWCLILILM